jgi:hypothetical protein
MFLQGSRYRNLPLISLPDASGVPTNSVIVRPANPAQGSFQHTVNSEDRLDLLAYKYYADSSRWWMISDGNPQADFPTDLLDNYPIRIDEIAVLPQDYLLRKENLASVLSGFGPLFRNHEEIWQATFTVEYPAATARAQIVAQIRKARFRILSSHSWPSGASVRESFTFTDPSVTLLWNNLLGALGQTPGVLDIASVRAGELFRLRYLETQLTPETIQNRIALAGFVYQPLASRRVEPLGTQILISDLQG